MFELGVRQANVPRQALLFQSPPLSESPSPSKSGASHHDRWACGKGKGRHSPCAASSGVAHSLAFGELVQLGAGVELAARCAADKLDCEGALAVIMSERETRPRHLPAPNAFTYSPRDRDVRPKLNETARRDSLLIASAYARLQDTTMATVTDPDVIEPNVTTVLQEMMLQLQLITKQLSGMQRPDSGSTGDDNFEKVDTSLQEKEEAWETVVDTLKEREQRTTDSWKDELNNILIFSGLFSAIATAFTIVSIAWLQQDPGDATNIFLAHFSLQFSNFVVTSNNINSSTPALPLQNVTSSLSLSLLRRTRQCPLGSESDVQSDRCLLRHHRTAMAATTPNPDWCFATASSQPSVTSLRRAHHVAGSRHYCALSCDSAGYIFAGVEMGDQCWCANELAASIVSAPLANECNWPCQGGYTYSCGAYERVQIFSKS
ncbi:hypothetical protein NM688_g5634 [Phlebia brevispora]|uniref:Uncharacterized protein n=1 Tax=Phlebia brevispora TaxID=194682 RepID=A0ACC1SS72_9APHY|nr:hypothetical protein NM688_g5634 [Phlebia brevispora]